MDLPVVEFPKEALLQMDAKIRLQNYRLIRKIARDKKWSEKEMLDLFLKKKYYEIDT